MEDEIQNKGRIEELRWQKRVNEIQSRNVLHDYPECKHLPCGMGEKRSGKAGWAWREESTKQKYSLSEGRHQHLSLPFSRRTTSSSLCWLPQPCLLALKYAPYINPMRQVPSGKRLFKGHHFNWQISEFKKKKKSLLKTEEDSVQINSTLCFEKVMWRFQAELNTTYLIKGG